jgi:hypothetical protein
MQSTLSFRGEYESKLRTPILYGKINSAKSKTVCRRYSLQADLPTYSG